MAGKKDKKDRGGTATAEQDEYFGQPEAKKEKETQPATAVKKENLPDISAQPLAHAVPRHDRVIVRKDSSRTATPGGILLPDNAVSKKPSGVVVAIGPGKYDNNGNLIPIGLKLGQRILMTDYAGLEIRDPMATRSSDDEYVILRDEDIIAVLP